MILKITAPLNTHSYFLLYYFSAGMKAVSSWTFSLAQYFNHQLSCCCHGNGSRLAEIYRIGDFEDITRQGAIVTFNLLRANGEYIGFSEVGCVKFLPDYFKHSNANLHGWAYNVVQMLVGVTFE